MPSITRNDGPSTSSNNNEGELTWSSALHLLEQSNPSPALSTFLNSNLAQLHDPANPFTPTGTKSTALTTTSSQSSRFEEAAAAEVEERFTLAKSTAQAAVRHCTKRGKREGDRISEEEWERITAWVFEERMSIIGFVSLLLRILDEDEYHPCHSIAAEHGPSFLNSTFAASILSSLVERTSKPLPVQIRRSTTLAKYWATQLVLEQKALLELLFLVFYSENYKLEGKDLVAVLDTVLKTIWGTQQELVGYMVPETQEVVKELGHLYSILAIEVLNLEVLMERSESPYPIPAPGETPLPSTSPFHPSHLASLTSIVELLVRLDGERSSPILLGWAFVTSRITESLLDRGVPNEYHDFAQASLKVETGSGGGPNSQQPLFQLYTSHALSTPSSLFPTLLSSLESSLFGYSRASNSYSSSASSDPNTIGYLSVLRGLILTIPHLVRLPFLDESQLAGLFETFSAIYANPSSTMLCTQVWRVLEVHDDLSMMLEEESAQSEAEKGIIELARSRFPIQFGPYIRLVRSLSAGLVSLLEPGPNQPSNGEALVSKCAHIAFDYLSVLPNLTHLLPSGISPLPYESLSYPDPETGYSIRCIQAIKVSDSLSIKPGTMGRLVSPPGSKPVVVSWDLSSGWSTWQLIGDLIVDYAGWGAGRKKGSDVFGSGRSGDNDLPIEWEDDMEKERDLVAALDLLRLTLRGDPSLGPVLMEQLDRSERDSSRPELVEALFKILDRSLALSTIPKTLVSSLVELIAALLPSFPGVVWTFLRASPQLFQTSSTSKSNSRFRNANSPSHILASEKVSGQYPVTLSLLTLVHSLVLESQIASRVVSAEYRSVKQGVLVRALGWVKEEVWSNYSSWKFSGLGQKFELAKKVVDIFDLVIEEGELEHGATQGTFSAPVKVVTDAFLSNTSASGISQLTPLLSTFTLGSSSIESLHRAGRYHDAMAIEDLVESSLRLTLQLLRLRSLVQDSTTSLLEKVLLTQNSSLNLSLNSSFAPSSTSFAESSISRQRPELLESILSFVVSPLSSTIAIQAAKVATLLCVLSSSQAAQDRTGLVALLGGSERAREIIVALLSTADDSGGILEVHIAVWDLLSAIVDSQPGLATLLVTGRQFPAFDLSLSTTGTPANDKGKGKEDAQPLYKSISFPANKPLSRTAFDTIIDSLQSWRDNWKTQPPLLAAILRFLDFVWQHLANYGDAIEELRTKKMIWQDLVDIAFEEVGPEPIEEEEVEPYCHRLMAKSHALRVITLDIEYALEKLGAKSQDSISFTTFVASFKDSKKLLSSLQSALASSSDPELHHEVHDLIRSSFPDLDLTSLRYPPPSHPLDRSRTCGPSYIYSLALLRRYLDGFLANQGEDERDNSMIGPEAFSDIVEHTAKLNCNFSLLEAQNMGTTSWRQSLETLLPLLRKDTAVQGAVVKVGVEVAKQIAREDRGGQIMQSHHEQRLQILLSLTEIINTASSPDATSTLVDLVGQVGSIFANTSLDVLDSVSRRTTPSFHSYLFRIAFFLSRQLNTTFASPSSLQSLSAEDKSRLSTQIGAILRLLLSSVRELFLLARMKKTYDVEQDLSLSIAALSQVLNSSFAPSPALWLAHCHSLDLFRSGFEVFVSMDQSDSGRPVTAQLVLDFCLLVANSSPQAAEQLALDGVMTALTNNALTDAAESGSIVPFSSLDGSQTAQHRIWTSMLALVVALVSALGESTRFVEQDVTGFVRLYGSQIARATSWTSSSSLTAGGLEELSLIVALLRALSRLSTRGGGGGGGSSSLASTVASAFVEQSLYLLQHLVYVLLHPNHLSSLVEGTTPEERSLVEQEANETDSTKKPINEAFTLAVLQLARDIVTSLVDYSDAWRIITREAAEWKTENAVVLPTATVTAGDKTSIGTLLDLVSHCTDLLSESPPLSTASNSPPNMSAFPSLPLPSPTNLRTTATETLEACLLLATTQFGLYGKLGVGPQPGQRGVAFSRTLTELATDLTESIEKALSTTQGGSKNGWLVQLLKSRISTWQQ
ncbi:Nup188p [Sporobolomyces salmoneus]|uniref:Nup188p n=1 Tax=Sporobolomyces salmoneus TaxID=183962 RepID=UPI00317E1B44